MTYEYALEYIHSVSWLGSKPGLSRITELLRAIGNPQNELKCIHVTGTNGKGSVCCMLSNILRCTGLKTGLYTSPYIERFNERIQINSLPISDSALCDMVEYIKPYADAMDDKPTEFEIITALAFEYFKREKVDIVVLEVGMGGEFDATNVISSPLLSVITPVGLDHTKILGDTVEEIAATKGGIIKSGCPSLYGGNDPRVERVLRTIAEKKESRYSTVDLSAEGNISLTLDGCTMDYKTFTAVNTPLLGAFQKINLATVLEAVIELRAEGITVSDDCVRRGLSETVWRARFELFATEPTVILDGAHNPMGVSSLAESLDIYFPGRKVNLLTGMMKDKDYITVAKTLVPYAARVYTVTPDNPRSMTSDELAEVYTSLGCTASAFDSIEEAVNRACDDTVDKHGILLCAGSLYMYGDVRKALEKAVNA